MNEAFLIRNITAKLRLGVPGQIPYHELDAIFNDKLEKPPIIVPLSNKQKQTMIEDPFYFF